MMLQLPLVNELNDHIIKLLNNIPSSKEQSKSLKIIAHKLTKFPKTIKIPMEYM